MCWQEVYGTYFFPFLGFRGCSLIQLERRYWGGLGLVWERRGRKCGFQLPCVFFGLFGRKETIRLLKMRGIQFKGVNCFSFVMFGHGLRDSFTLTPFFFFSLVYYLYTGNNWEYVTSNGAYNIILL